MYFHFFFLLCCATETVKVKVSSFSFFPTTNLILLLAIELPFTLYFFNNERTKEVYVVYYRDIEYKHGYGVVF